jgi:hypothetical protein
MTIPLAGIERGILAACLVLALLCERPALAQTEPNPEPPPADVAQPAEGAPAEAPEEGSEAAAPRVSESAAAEPPAQWEPAPAELPPAAPAELEAPKASAEPTPKAQKTIDFWSKVSLGTEWYLSAGFGEQGGQSYSRTRIERGYLTLKIKPVEWFQPRVTLDTHQDDSGDWKVRLKYMYAKFVVPVETAVVTDPNVEFGLVHGPWFDYEEHINHYRMQGTMLIERNGVLNSADVGITAAALLGRKLPKDYQKSVSKEYPGEFGSVAFGVYDGGGYHAAENNRNKVFESRISVRPLGPYLPNLQLSYLAIYGKGNTPPQVCDAQGQNCVRGEPDWRLSAGMASFEHPYFVATAQVAKGRGNQAGSRVDGAGAALHFKGVSGFAEIKLPWILSSVIGRYDRWEWNSVSTDRVIAGYAFHFLDDNTVLLDYDREMPDASNTPDAWQTKVTVQVVVP